MIHSRQQILTICQKGVENLKQRGLHTNDKDKSNILDGIHPYKDNYIMHFKNTTFTLRGCCHSSVGENLILCSPVFYAITS